MRLIWNVVSDDLSTVAAFYADVLGFETSFESDWYIQLARDGFEIGILKKKHEIDPTDPESASGGRNYPTFVVDDFSTVVERATARNAIMRPPEDLFYGQRRLLLLDPDGRIIDVSTPIPAG